MSAGRTCCRKSAFQEANLGCLDADLAASPHLASWRRLSVSPSLTSRTSGPGCRFEREGLHRDLAVPHEKRIGPELICVLGRLGDPPDVGNIALDHLLLQV